MPSLSDRRLDQTKFFNLYARLACAQHGTLVTTYSYNDVKRMIRVDGDDIEADGDDPLSEIIVQGVKDLPHQETDRQTNKTTDIDPPASMAALFQDHPIARSLKPKLWVALDLQQEDLSVCGMLTACTFEVDRALSTQRLTPAYCSQHGLPRLGAQWMLVDVVAASKPKTGALLLLHAILAALRSGKAGVCSVAVTAAGRKLFSYFGFDTSHSWREGGRQRFLCHAKRDDIRLSRVHERLKVHEELITDVCFRTGLTARTADRLIGRC